MGVVVVLKQIAVVLLKGVQLQVLESVAGARAPGLRLPCHFAGGFPQGDAHLAAALAVWLLLPLLHLLDGVHRTVVADDARLVNSDDAGHDAGQDNDADHWMMPAYRKVIYNPDEGYQKQTRQSGLGLQQDDGEEEQAHRTQNENPCPGLHSAPVAFGVLEQQEQGKGHIHCHIGGVLEDGEEYVVHILALAAVEGTVASEREDENAVQHASGNEGGEERLAACGGEVLWLVGEYDQRGDQQPQPAVEGGEGGAFVGGYQQSVKGY